MNSIRLYYTYLKIMATQQQPEIIAEIIIIPLALLL